MFVIVEKFTWEREKQLFILHLRTVFFTTVVHCRFTILQIITIFGLQSNYSMYDKRG